MPSQPTAAARLVRATAMTTLVVATAALAHLLGGGMVPTTGILVALVLLTLPFALLAVRRPPGLVVTVAALGLGQLALHHVLAWVPMCAPDTGGALVLTGHHAAHGVGSWAGALCTSTPDPTGPLLGTTSMLALHVVATLVTSVLLRTTDRAAVRVLSWLRPLLTPPTTRPLPVGTAPAVVAPRTVRAPRAPWRVVVAPRGPPLGTVLARTS